MMMSWYLTLQVTYAVSQNIMEHVMKAQYEWLPIVTVMRNNTVRYGLLQGEKYREIRGICEVSLAKKLGSFIFLTSKLSRSDGLLQIALS